LFLNWLPSEDSAENFIGNIISTRLKYTILKPKYIGIYHISLLFSRRILTSKEIDGKTYSETEQNMSEKQGKGQIMLHLPMTDIFIGNFFKLNL
jgi:hypothetical protein